MEIKARYLLMGLFVVVAIGAGFVFTYWMNTMGSFGQRDNYQVLFDFPVPGLLKGSTVQFNGIRVGEVTELRLDAGRPGRTVATIAVDAGTPIRSDTFVGLDFRGLTGAAAISLAGGLPTAAPLTAEPDGLPVLVANPTAGQDVMASARSTLQRIDRLLDENSEPLKNAIADIGTFSAALSRNADKIDTIATGLANTFGGGGEKPTPAGFELTAPTEFAGLGTVPEGQLVLPVPTTVIQLDTTRILVDENKAIKPAFEDGKWADNIPLLIQTTLVRSFENAGFPGASKADDGLDGDHQLIIDIRDFTIEAGEQNKARVGLGAKIVDRDGAIVASKIFTSEAPVAAMETAQAAAGMDQAFGTIATELVTWALGAI